MLRETEEIHRIFKP